MENKKEMKKNNNNVLIIIIVVLAFLVGALGTYVVMDRLNSEDVPVLDGGNENEQDEDDKNGEVSIPTNPDEVAGAGSINTVDYVYGDFNENPTSLGITPVLVDSKTVEFSVNASIFERLRFIANSESIDVEDDALNEIAKMCDGAMRDAIGTLDQLSSYSDKSITIDDIYT